MLQLLKQIFKSFKKNFLLLFGIVFICSVIIFSGISFFYLDKNIADSLNFLNTNGNKSNALVMLNFKNSDVTYKQTKTNPASDQKVDIFDIDKFEPVNENIWVSSVQITNNKYNVVFPYKDSDFTNPKLNSNPYATRTFGMLATYGADKDGNAYPMDLGTDLSQRRVLAYSFSNTKTSHVNLNNLVFDKEGKYLSSFINSNSFSNQMTLYYSHFVPTKNLGETVPTDSSLLTRGEFDIYKGINPNLTFLDAQILWGSLNLGKKTNYDLVKLTPEGDAFKFLLINKKQEMHPVYNLELSLDGLSDLDKEIINEIEKINLQTATVEERKIKETFNELKNISIPLKDSWWNQDTFVKRSILESGISQAVDETKNFINKYREKFILKKINDYVNEKKIKASLSEQKQFVLRDEETSNKYIISKKSNVESDKLVYTSGTKLEENEKEISIENIFNGEIPDWNIGNVSFPDWNPNNEKNDKFFFNLIEFFSNSLISSKPQLPKKLIEAFNVIIDAVKNKKLIDVGMYRYIFCYFALNSIYSNPVSHVYYNDNGLSITMKLKLGLTQIYDETTVIKPILSTYGIVVSDKFLKLNNKQIIDPQTWKNKIWQVENNIISYQEFNDWFDKLDQKHLIKINGRKLGIIGTGISPEMAFPSTEYETPFPNPSSESLVYVTDAGYKTLINQSPYSFQYKYLSVDFKDLYFYSSYINDLNTILKKYLYSENNAPVVYSLNDFDAVKNLLTIRTGIPIKLRQIINTTSVVLIVLFAILGLYLAYLLIKGYINNNIVELAIIKANGFSSLSITFAISMFGLVTSILASVIGYSIAFILQPLFFNIIDYYWFIPVSFDLYSPIILFVIMASLFLIFMIYSLIILRIKFKTPINQLINDIAEVKSNKFLTTFFRKTPKNISPLFKLRMSLSFSNIWRTMFFVSLCSLGMSVTSIGMALPEKMNESFSNTIKSKNYDYRFSLFESNDQTGIYKTQPYERMGVTDLKQGIFPIYKSSTVDNELAELAKQQNVPLKEGFYYNREFYTSSEPNKLHGSPYHMADLKLRDIFGKPLWDEYGNPMYLGNMLIPSYTSLEKFKRNPNFFHNLVFTKWLLDFTIPTFNLNPWLTIKSKLPIEIVTRAESQGQSFLESIYNFKVTDLGDDTPKLNYQESDYINAVKEFNQQAKKFLKYDVAKNIYSIDASKTMSIGEPSEIGFNQEFLHFIGKVYGQKSLSKKDVKLSFSIIPSDGENTEFFSQANVSMYKYYRKDNDIDWTNPEVKKQRLTSNSINLIGIKNNSKFVNLLDDKNTNLADLLYKSDNPSNDSSSKKDYFEVVVNKGSAYKYNLNENDYFYVESNNGYFDKSYNFFEKYISEKTDNNLRQKIVNPIYKFKVIGISNLSYDNEFYVTQDVANIINGSKVKESQDQNKWWNNQYNSFGGKYSTNRKFYKTSQLPSGEKNFNEKYLTDRNDGTGKLSFLYEADYQIDYIDPLNNYFLNLMKNSNDTQMLNAYNDYVKQFMPFNGIFYKGNSPIFLNKNLAFFAGNGVWNLFNYSSKEVLSKTLNSYEPKSIYLFGMLFTTTNEKIYELTNQIKKLNITNNDQMFVQITTKILDNKFKNVQDVLIDVYHSKDMGIAFSSVEVFNLVSETFTNLSKTIDLINKISLTITIPLVIVMILVISSSMLSNYNDIILVLKTLGYNDSENIHTIFFVFTPVIIISLVIGIILMLLTLFSLQSIIYALTSIYISAGLLLIPSVIGLSIVLLIILINFIFIYIIYKKQKLSDVIKY